MSAAFTSDLIVRPARAQTRLGLACPCAAVAPGPRDVARVLATIGQLETPGVAVVGPALVTACTTGTPRWFTLPLAARSLHVSLDAVPALRRAIEITGGGRADLQRGAAGRCRMSAAITSDRIVKPARAPTRPSLAHTWAAAAPGPRAAARALPKIGQLETHAAAVVGSALVMARTTGTPRWLARSPVRQPPDVPLEAIPRSRRAITIAGGGATDDGAWGVA